MYVAALQRLGLAPTLITQNVSLLVPFGPLEIDHIKFGSGRPPASQSITLRSDRNRSPGPRASRHTGLCALLEEQTYTAPRRVSGSAGQVESYVGASRKAGARRKGQDESRWRCGWPSRLILITMTDRQILLGGSGWREVRLVRRSSLYRLRSA